MLCSIHIWFCRWHTKAYAPFLSFSRSELILVILMAMGVAYQGLVGLSPREPVQSSFGTSILDRPKYISSAIAKKGSRVTGRV